MNKRRILTFLLVMVSTVFLYSSASGQARENNITEISNNGSSVSWTIRAQYETATLTVSTPGGEVIRREFKAGSIPTFSPTSERGEFYGTGRYNYEIVLTPVLSKETQTALAQAQITGNRAEIIENLRKRGLMPAEMADSGTFTFENGTLITGNETGSRALVEPPATGGEPDKNAGGRDTDNPVDGDQQILDDLIVQGSACVGQDCSNGESFGFDTLRLKENNLRLNFDDTSSTASFPSNDWRITANDSSNGGLSYLGFEDSTAGRTPFRIVAGAPANSLYVTSAGRIGLGTSTPSVQLQVTHGNTPTLRLEQNGSSGFTPQTWDVAGNEANFFIRDATTGSRLIFRIFPGAPSDSLRIEANGDVKVKNLVVAGTGTSATAPAAAQTFYGGQAVILPSPSSNIIPAVDTNSFGITTNGQAGFATVLVNVPTSLNLAGSGANVVYKIRYQDEDGSGASASLTVSVVGNNLTTGVRNVQTVFSSGSGGSAETTATVCMATGTTAFNYDTHATHLSVVLFGSAGISARLLQIQVYKISGSC